MALLALPGTALGAQRFASPEGGGDCSSGSPCTLPVAVNGAGVGDEVIVAAGDYNVGSTALVLPAGTTVHGADGQSRPSIVGATDILSGALVQMPAGGTLRHLAVRQDGPGGLPGTPIAVNAATGTLGDVAVRNTQPEGTAARLGAAAVMSGSTALASTAISAAGLGVTLHNVTAWATGAGIVAETGTSVTGTNVIARAPGGSDVSGAVTLATSNYGGAPAPLLANPAAGDFHQLPGSPTIDAGLPDPLAGLTDIDGDARILGATQDIGADEYISHRPAATTGDASDATVTGTVMPNGLPTSYRFDFGSTPLYGSSTPAGDAGSTATPTPVSAQLPGLAPGSIIHYRVVATNADGKTAGLDRILVAPGTLTGPQLNKPHFDSLTAPSSVTVGEPVVIKAAGSDRNDPVNSIAIDFDDGPGFFAESACRLRPRNRAFRDGRLQRFSVPYTFTTPGVHTIAITLASGECGRQRQRTTQTTQITVTPAAKRLARVRASAGVTTAGDCPNADLLPAPGNTRAIEAATFCLLNQQRVANGLGPFRRNKKLRRAAKLHNGYMLRDHFMAHQGPGEPPLGARFRKVRYRGGGGENIGVGAGMPYATPRSMVIAWMGSPVHRANILESAFHTIGIAVAAEKPVPPPPIPGATYTTEFGTTRK